MHLAHSRIYIMNDVLKDVIGKFVIVYLDDIAVYNRTRLSITSIYKLYCSCYVSMSYMLTWPNCKCVQPELNFLGHIVGAQGRRVDPQKVAIVQDWPVPKDKNFHYYC